MKRLLCFFIGHKIVWYVKKNFLFGIKLRKKCERCGIHFGVPEFENPPAPPVKKDN